MASKSILNYPLSCVTHHFLSYLAQRRFESDKRTAHTVPTLTSYVHHDCDAVVVEDPLYRALSSSRTPEGYSNGKSSSSSTRACHKESTPPPALVGRNSNLEKPYFRLTTFADPNHVRSLPVLVKALAHIKNKYMAEENFEWANEQLKSVRQDLTVQRIRNPFVLEGRWKALCHGST